MRTMAKNAPHIAASGETQKRTREVMLSINIADPDPEFQPFIGTDEASLLDCVGTAPTAIAKRMDAYFGADLKLDLTAPVWRLVDAFQRVRTGWPDPLAGDPHP